MQPEDPRDRRIAELEAQLAAALIVIDRLTARVADLEARLARNSMNSSNPPSSDPPGTMRPRSKMSGRKPGGQPGHKGHRRELVPVEDVDKLTVLKPSHCGKCEAPLDGEDSEPLRHQVIELPPMRPLVLEWQQWARGCRRCGAVTRAELPSDVPRTGFGDRLCALVALLAGKCHLTKRTTQELLADAFGIEMGLGSVSNIEQTMSGALAPGVEAARTHVRAAAVVHPDETSWRQARDKAWLWTAATPTVTVFQINRSRGGDVARAMLGDPFLGKAVSDRWSGYNWIPVEQRQVCLSHLIRDFQEIEDRGGVGAWVGTLLLKQMTKIFHWWHRMRDGKMTRECLQKKSGAIEREVGQLLRLGGVCGNAKTAGMCTEILKLESALWTFVYHDGVEPTNNRAERAIRPAVLWRKGSFGTHSAAGSRFVERVLTVVATLKQQGRNIFDYLVAAAHSRFDGRPLPSLLPSA